MALFARNKGAPLRPDAIAERLLVSHFQATDALESLVNHKLLEVVEYDAIDGARFGVPRKGRQYP